jgi:uncharacterized protein YndB with AHSA1/START domain
MRAHRRITIDSPSEVVWLCLTDPALVKQWITNMVDDIPEHPGRPIGVGTRSTMRLREGKRIRDYTCIITAWEPGKHLAIRMAGGSFAPGMEMDVRYQLSPVPEGRTLLDFDVQVPMKGWFRLMAPLFKLMAAGNTNRELAKLQEVARTASVGATRD